MTVWLAQCLCPQRHAILAAAGEAEDQAVAEESIAKPLRSKVAELVASDTINTWCGLCMSPVESWSYELARTRFRSMEEAEPSLRRSERQQSVVRQAFGQARGFWMDETSGVLRPAILAYLQGDNMTVEQIAAMREYLRQWIAPRTWAGPHIDLLRSRVDELHTRVAIRRWLDLAEEIGIDPL